MKDRPNITVSQAYALLEKNKFMDYNFDQEWSFVIEPGCNETQENVLALRFDPHTAFLETYAVKDGAWYFVN